MLQTSDAGGHTALASSVRAKTERIRLLDIADLGLKALRCEFGHEPFTTDSRE